MERLILMIVTMSAAKQYDTFNKTLSDGIYTWNCLATDNDNNARFAANNRTLIIDHIPPHMNLSSPLVGDNITSQPILFNLQ